MAGMTIQVLDSLAGQDALGSFSYGKGIHEGVPGERAAELIRAGHAIPVPTDKTEKAIPNPARIEKRKK